MKTTFLFFALCLPASADIINFASSAATPNNAFALTVDLGASDIVGADFLTIEPTYGLTAVGFAAMGTYVGTPISGWVTVESSPGSQVQFDSTWLTADLAAGPQTFVLPLDLLLANTGYSFACFSASEGCAFKGQIETGTPSPEPGTWLLGVFGVSLIVLARHSNRWS